MKLPCEGIPESFAWISLRSAWDHLPSEEEGRKDMESGPVEIYYSSNDQWRNYLHSFQLPS
jgi:hypothetical protein